MPGSEHDTFSDAPRNINFVYNQLDKTLDTKLPPEKIKPEKYFLVGIFFFFAIGIVVSIIVLVSNVDRAQKAQPVAAEETVTTPSVFIEK